MGFLSQAVRTSRRQSFKNNIDVLIIGVAYTVVVRLPSLVFSSLGGSIFSDDDEKVRDVVGVLREASDINVPKAAEVIEGTSRSPQRRYPKGA
jgi:hypothetical protein